MDIVPVSVINYSLFCPITGQQIYAEEFFNTDHKIVAGTWCSLSGCEAMLNDDELEKKWDEFLIKLQKELEDDDEDEEKVGNENETDSEYYDYTFEDVGDFIAELQMPTGYVCFEINNGGMACGPINDTIYVILNLFFHSADETDLVDYEDEEDDDE